MSTKVPFLGRGVRRGYSTPPSSSLLTSALCSWKPYQEILWWSQGYLEMPYCFLVTWSLWLCPRLLLLLLGLWSWGRARWPLLGMLDVSMGGLADLMVQLR